jgi:predicted Rossmann-fold nucleotide-binding protein
MGKTMRVIVCGGRDFTDRKALETALDRLNLERGIACVISGAASGADTLAVEWAAKRGVPVSLYPADWKKWGDAAGPIRNRFMLNDSKPDGVVAFPGGSGTADMIGVARMSGLKVWQPMKVDK